MPLRAYSTLLLVLTMACAAEEQPPAQSQPASFTVADAEGLGVRNARMPVPGLVTGGQLTPEQLDGLVAAGYRNFISLRPEAEDGAGWEETHVSGPASFARVPVAGGAGLTRENVEALDRLLDEAAQEGTVLYCASGNRVGALLALRAAWLDGASADEALALGRAAGLRGLEPAVTELLER